ncbi:MAG TPA: TIGR00159 family protein [candidate division Zixibacteria bacterium]|nr:TIGR00159 family protein [candidate division Zixibacteria bacterium]
MTFFRFLFFEFGLMDVIDILVVALIVYSFLLLMKGTRAVTMLIGLGTILFLMFLSTWMDMNSLKWLSAHLGTVWIIAFIIVFQPELRNALMRLGNAPLFRRLVGSRSRKAAASVVNAVDVLSSAKVGALIAIKRDVGLKGYIETGKRIAAEATSELLVTIFTPHTPLHDGAVIIEDDTISAAGCELPLTTNPRYQRSLGMRHRAGLGLSEETDAVIVIVSEETGAISLAIRGNLRRNLTLDNLRKLLDISLKGNDK